MRPAVRLTEIFRQAAKSMIVRAAHAVNNGEFPPTSPSEGDLRDFFLIGGEDPASIFAEICDLASRRLPEHYDLDPVERCRCSRRCTAARSGSMRSTTSCARLNPDGELIPGTPLRVGDVVIQLRNNHERQLMNGERGVLVHHDRDEDTVILACDDGRRLTLDVRELDMLRLAHATSIHKAQGSQAPAVIVPLHRSHHVMLTRNLVYTALTRAQRIAVLVGQPTPSGSRWAAATPTRAIPAWRSLSAFRPLQRVGETRGTRGSAGPPSISQSVMTTSSAPSFRQTNTSDRSTRSRT